MQQRDVLTHDSPPTIAIAQTGTVLLVDAQGHGDYGTIAEAIAHAPDHSTIFLAAGTYRESFTIDRPLTILGDEQDRPEIAGRIVCDSDHILLQNLFLNSAHSESQIVTASVTQVKGDLQIKNCLIQAGQDNAFNLISSQAKLAASQCVIQNSKVGIYSDDCDQIKLDNCEIKQNGNGISINRCREMILNDCQVYSSRDNGIQLKAGDRATISHCKIFNNQGIGILLENIIEFDINHTELFDHGKNGVCISRRSRGTIEQCNFHGNSWPSLFLDGEANAEVSHSHFYEGFTEAIKICEASYLKVTKTTIERHNEKAILVNQNCNLILKNCSILENTDAGLYIVQHGCAIVENTRFRGNGYGRKVGAIATYGNLIVRYCSINHNYFGIQAYGNASIILKLTNLGFNKIAGLSVKGPAAIAKSAIYEGIKLPNLKLSWDKNVSIGLVSLALVSTYFSSSATKTTQSKLSQAQSQLDKLIHEQTMQSIESSRYQTDQSLAQITLQNAYNQEKNSQPPSSKPYRNRS
jgi:parallel beta-helix repeat protein